jgi:hypothetical protein
MPFLRRSRARDILNVAITVIAMSAVLWAMPDGVPLPARLVIGLAGGHVVHFLIGRCVNPS